MREKPVCWQHQLTGSYRLKLCKGCAREFDRVSGDWSAWVKAASDLFNLMYKDFIKLIRKRLRGNI